MMIAGRCANCSQLFISRPFRRSTAPHRDETNLLIKLKVDVEDADRFKVALAPPSIPAMWISGQSHSSFTRPGNFMTPAEIKLFQGIRDRNSRAAFAQMLSFDARSPWRESKLFSTVYKHKQSENYFIVCEIRSYRCIPLDVAAFVRFLRLCWSAETSVRDFSELSRK